MTVIQNSYALSYWWTFGSFLVFVCEKLNSCEHSQTSLCMDIYILFSWVNTLEAESIVGACLTFQEIAKLFSKWLYNFLFLWASYESSNSSVFSQTLGLASFLNFSCSHRCIVLFHCTFNFNFSSIYHLKYFVKYLFKSFVYSLGCYL